MALITAEEYLKQKSTTKKVTPTEKSKGLISAEEYLQQKKQGVKPAPATPKQIPVAPQQPLKTFQPVPMPRPVQPKTFQPVPMPRGSVTSQQRAQTLASAPNALKPLIAKVNQALDAAEQSNVGKFQTRAGEQAVATAAFAPDWVQTDTGSPTANTIADIVGTVLGIATPQGGGAAFNVAEQAAARGIAKVSPKVAQAIPKAVPKVVPKIIESKIAQAGLSAGAGGAAYGATKGLVEGKDTKGIAKEALKEGALMVPFGAGAKVVEKGIGKVASKIAESKVAKIEKGRNILADVNEAYAQAKKVEVKPQPKPMLKQAEKTTPLKRPTIPEKAPSNIKTLPAKEQPNVEARAGQLGQLEAKLAQQVNETIEPAVAKVGMRVQKLQNAPKGSKTTPEYKFSDPEVEARWQKASKGVQKEGLFERTKEAFRSLGIKATREYEHLPKTKEWAQARFDLLKMEKQKGVAGDRTLRIQQGLTAKLEKPEFDLFTRKVILDDLAREEGSLPFGFSKESLAKEKASIDSAIASNPKIAEAVTQRKEAWEAIKSDYVQAMKDIGFDVSDRLSKEDYFRHQVLEYSNAKNITGTGQKLKTPTGRGFLKSREGSSKDINTNYLQAEYEVMAQMIHDIEVAKTIKGIEKNYSIRDELVKKHGKKWNENIPEGYTVWQPRQGTGFYLADSIPAKVADQLYSGIAKEIGITEEMLSKVIAKGSRFKEFVIKEELAKTLNKLSEPPSESVVGKFSSTITGAWKQWQLLSPRRFIKYNLRNLSEIDRVFAGNPKSMSKVPQSVRELYQLFAGDRAMAADMKDWFERGGMQTLLQVQELGDINKLRMFANIQNAKGTVKEFPVKAWQGYWKTVRMSTDFREAIFRYSNYLDYLEQMKRNNGKPLNYGASIPEEINGLSDIRDKAFKLSNELLGAYDAVSMLGKDIRKHIIPFWSFQETNFRSYVQMIKNAARDEKLAQFAGRKLLGTAVRSPFIAMRVGSFAIKASAMWGALQAYNYTRFPDEESDLPKDVQARPHIVLGRDAEGNVRYFDRLGTLGDFLSWFGLDTPAREVSDFLNGKRTVKEIATDMAKSPVNKLTQGIAPLIKTPAEAISGYKFFPDTFKPTKIRDMKDYFAQSFGVESEFRALTDRPSKPYGASLSSLYEYKTNPDQVAYYNIQDEKRRFEKKIGKLSEGFMTSPRSEALYNYKLSLRYKDKEAAEKYLQEYMLLGGKKEDMEQSLETMHPLYGLNRDDVKQFLQSLRQEERDELAKSIRYYESLVPPKLATKSRKKYKGAPKV